MISMPDWIVPMAATLTQERFAAPDWVFERKFDGIRLIAFKRGAEVSLFSRNRLPQHQPAIAGAIAQLPANEAIFDGEMTWSHGGCQFHVFDVVWLDGDVRTRALDDRRKLLASLPLTPPLTRVELVTGDEPWIQACSEGWEGVIAKRRTSPYEHRRSPHWLKMKCELTQAFLIGGFTDPQGSRVGLGALLIGHCQGDDLVFAGRVGTGFDHEQLRAVRAELDRLEIPASPFTKAVGLPRLRAHWVRPELAVAVSFIEWTGNGKLRHPRLVGLPSPAADVSARS